jgi:hypothetical protein
VRGDEAVDLLFGELQLLERYLRRNIACKLHEEGSRKGRDKKANHLLHLKDPRLVGFECDQGRLS